MEADQLSAFARRLKELRETRGVSQQSLATAAGLSISVVRQLEQGSREDPRLSTVLALAKALDVDVNDLVSEVKRSATPPAEDLEAVAKGKAGSPKPRARKKK